MKLKKQLKAVVGGMVAGLGALGTALADSSVSGQEWTVIAVAALAAYGGVYRTRQPMPPSSSLTADELLKLAEKRADQEQR